MIFNRLFLSIAFILVLSPIMVSCGQKEESAQSGVSSIQVPDKFVGVEKQLVGKLFEMWGKKGHVASVDQAAAVLGVELTDSVRISLFKKFNENLNIHERLGRYRAGVFILTNEEKRISEYIVRNEKKNQEFPTLQQVANDLNLTEDHVADRLRFLSTIEMFYDLGGPDEYNKLGFSFGHKFGDVTYDLGIHQHTFSVDGGLPINVGCAKEALFVVASEFPKNHVTYRAYDPISLEPIDVVFKDDEIISIQPETAKLFEGGTCGTNNLFANEANAHTYALTLPQFQNKEAPIVDIKARFADTKAQVAKPN